MEPIAIVGMSVIFPGAPDLATYWRNLIQGVDSITDVPEGRWDPEFYQPNKGKRADRIYCRRGGFVDQFAEIDFGEFGIMPNSIRDAEPDQLIALQVAARAIKDAGALPEDRRRVGVVLGRGGYLTPGLARLDQRVRVASQVVRTLGELMPELGEDRLDEIRDAYLDQLGPEAPESVIGMVPNLAASRLANRLDLRGPAYTVDAACASSLIAVDQAIGELNSGRCDLMLAGGVHHCHDITTWSVFNQLGALSPTMRMRPFHQDADGVLIGEGTGVVVLKRLADAERDGDRIYSVITGTGIASDGRTSSLFNPDSGGQVEAVRQAWQAAGLDPMAADSIGLLEAHGTATVAGDGAELSTLVEVFGPPGDGERAVIGSVKSMIGHTMPAAGVAGLIKAALAVYHGVLPPTLHCEEPNPELLRTRFEPVDTARRWTPPDAQPIRRAAVNAFGFGGINAHVILEQAPGTHARVAVAEPERVLRLAASDPSALGVLLDASDTDVLALDQDHDQLAGPSRLGIVDPTAKRLALARRMVAKGAGWRGRNDVWFAPRPLLGPGGGKLAFVFPGLEAESVEQDLVGQVGRHGNSVIRLGRQLDAAVRRLDVRPDAMAGHSVGEWTAMVCAGIHADDEVDAFWADFDPDSLQVPGLAFAAIGARADEVLTVLAGRPDVVLSHDNAPNQSMICGPVAAVEELVQGFLARGVMAQILPFQSGFHTPMFEPYLGPILAHAEKLTLHPARVPIWSATISAEYPSSEAGVRELFIRHLLEPVRFRTMIEAMYADGFRAFLQMGAGQSGSLIKDTLRDQDHLVLEAHSSTRAGIAQLRRVAVGLWVDGAAPNQQVFAGPSTSSGSGVVGSGSGETGSGSEVKRRITRLDLGSAMISLPADQRARLRISPSHSPAADPALATLASHGPLAAELAALMTDTANTATELLTTRRTAPPPRQPSLPEPAPPLPELVEGPEVLRVSLAEMPYLIDHCFFAQRPGWPVDADRFPVVPATTVIHHLQEFAERSAPGSRAVTVRNVQLNQWILAVPEVEVPVRVVPIEQGLVQASLGGYSQAQIELAPHYPHPRPEVWRLDAAAERTPELTAKELYSERWMFHGPLFQGVTELTAIADHHVRGLLTTPDAPGALLDNVGQLFAFWVMSTLPDRSTVFPVQVEKINFFGPHPPAGTTLECLIKITEVTNGFVDAEMQLIIDGEVWAEIRGWRDRRFDSNERMRAVDYRPAQNTLSEPQPEGWMAVWEHWPDLATRELMIRRQLGGGDEHSRYLQQPPRSRRGWLLGRIAAKDAARHRLWEQGADDIYPVEIQVHNKDSGQPYLLGMHGRDLPELGVSIAHRGEVGVAMVGSGRCGIDVEEIVERPASTHQVACGPAELNLLTECAAQTAGGMTEWFTRFWTAKEAVAKLLGTGLLGAPQKFRVVSASTDRLTVRVGDHDHFVRCRTIANPKNLPPRTYVVAWTTE